MPEALEMAIRWAVERHAGQVRDGEPALPYATHPIEVMAILRASGCQDAEMLCVAALHDLVEETDTTVEEISKAFGTEVSALVDELTRAEPSRDQTAGMTKDEIWELRTQMLLDEIKAMSPRAQIIKMCDRLSNLREARTTRPPQKLERYQRQTRMILEIIPRSVQPDLWDELETLAE